MLSAIAIDDEPQALQVVHLLAAKVPFLTLQATFTNAFTALAYLHTHPVDVLFVDIHMPDITGLELVQGLSRAPLIIFTTAYSDYAVQGFELDAVDYLLKPFSLARFTKACGKALDRQTGRGMAGRPAILVKTGLAEERVLLENILYLEADGNYLTYVLTARRVLTRQTLAEALQQLPPQYFVRVHRSYIVALSKVDKIARHEVSVAGTSIPIGSSYESAVQALRAHAAR
ncbi:LytR/AlgR family response regulator transcription factor [Hymenobacter volaticus]|uniref:LytTR family DNA-binding domain-containing protein n=1 Tax=Hymenobacter volaticus TaxID=2932254 RepID=A0ABY4GFV9_9BACT|nr:LytTR family DNA-binding domain-containing protein [Hymenobacter volaticus]UOQ69204.1 LytTR family DNA-binding domain-containing protein [Hymenobacter volaticus]